MNARSYLRHGLPWLLALASLVAASGCGRQAPIRAVGRWIETGPTVQPKGQEGYILLHPNGRGVVNFGYIRGGANHPAGGPMDHPCAWRQEGRRVVIDYDRADADDMTAELTEGGKKLVLVGFIEFTRDGK